MSWYSSSLHARLTQVLPPVRCARPNSGKPTFALALLTFLACDLTVMGLGIGWEGHPETVRLDDAIGSSGVLEGRIARGASGAAAFGASWGLPQGFGALARLPSEIRRAEKPLRTLQGVRRPASSCGSHGSRRSVPMRRASLS